MSTAARTSSNAMPQSSRRLLNTPTENSEARSVREAKAVPIWPTTIAEEGHRRRLLVGVVKRRALADRVARAASRPCSRT